MDESLQRIVFERLSADGSLEHDWSIYVISACNSEGELDGALSLSPTDSAAISVPPTVAATPTGAYLSSVTVQGFRGIGPESSLKLHPGPGLTLVVGRNGSGKSSFAEGLEVLFTGDSGRWAGRTGVWKEGWRNLHHSHPVLIEAALAVEGEGSARASRRWEQSDRLQDGSAGIQPHGKPKRGLDYLGWDQSLVTYRPFLSYNELSSMLDEGPAKLYDALSLVLGLEDLVRAQDALAAARRVRKRAIDDAKQAVAPVRSQLELLQAEGDQRAGACLAALGGRDWDLDALEAVIGEGAVASEDIGILNAVLALDSPSAASVADAASRLTEAAQSLQALTSTDAHRAWRLASLLEGALELHDHTAFERCPVCYRPDPLGPDWRTRTQEEAVRLRTEAAAWDKAEQGVRAAMQSARDLLSSPPAALGDGDGILDCRAALQAWKQWGSGRSYEAPEDLGRHLLEAHDALHSALDALKSQAREELLARQERWKPVALELAEWLSQARPASNGAKQLPDLKAAEDWLKSTGEAIRTQRFEPIGAKAIELWTHLRQQSNVELGRIELVGARNRRRVTLDVTVDGVAGAALGVMSQGELHALALSLFLPRATLEDSPFRFVVLDDPVQSMDPARVDGLARALEEVAKTRQLVVFTHDERLPEAVRRLGIEARTIGVTRRAASVVELREIAHPVTTYLSDGRALAYDTKLPEDVRRRVVPGFCRLALEAVFMDIVRQRRLNAGTPHADVEEALTSTTTLTSSAALALFDDKSRGGDVMSRLNQFGAWAGDVFKQINKGAHHPGAGNLIDLVANAERLCKKIATTC